MPEDWDAATYDRISDIQTRWGATVLERLNVGGSERVLDAGCGTGRVTEVLLHRLPQGRVVALDASAAMLAEARRRLSPWGDRVEFVQADLGEPWVSVQTVGEPVDAAISTATLHWVRDHDTAFANLAGALRPGGALVAQCGGPGNVARVLTAAADLGRTTDAVTFPDAAGTAARLRVAGFVDVRTWVTPESAAFATAADLEANLATVVLRTHVDGMDSAERADFVRAVARRLRGREIDYVRLNITARRRGRARSVADL